MIVIGIIGLVYMKAETDKLQEDFETQIDCPETVTQEQAYLDYNKEDKEAKVGLMHCYCLNEFKANTTDSFDKSFENVNAGDERKYCEEWFVNYSW